MKICVICGREYSPRNCRQVTCGDEECQYKYKLEAQAKRGETRRIRRRLAKQKQARARGATAPVIEENVEGIFPRPLPRYGSPTDYGRKQMEKTLASVPKIKTEL